MSSIRVTYSGLIGLVIGLSSVITGMIFILIVTRSLTPEELGTWGLVGGLITYVVILEPMISYWTQREIARDIDSGKKDQETTYGWRPMTYDGLPLIDRSFALKNLMIAAGHNMVGMGMGPMTGKIVADIVGKETSKINLEPYKFRKL